MITARRRVLLLLALALGCGAAPAVAQAASIPGVAITSVQAGYEFAGGGNYRLNGPALLRPGDVWVPVRVTLRNDGGSDVKARLVISDNGPQNSTLPYRTDYTLDVSLPTGAQNAVTMYARAADVGSQVVVDLEVGGKVVSTQTAQISPQQGGALSIGVLSDDTAPRTILRSLKFGDTSLSVAQFDDATPLDPQPQALENFDLIVLTNYSSDALTGAQMQALRAWVQGGGTLLVAGGPDAQKTMAHLGPDLQAATLHSTIVANALPELARIAGGPVATSGPVELSVATPRPGAAVLAARNGVPLAVDLPLGRGHLVYSALEPTLAPFNTWPLGAQGDFWSHLLAPALVGPRDALVQDAAQNPAQTIGPGGPNNSVQNISGDLGNLPSRSMPSLQIYAVLIVLYILALGPLNFMLLRWRRHLEWSWVTVPVVAGLFSLGSFGLAYARNGGDVLVHIDTVVYLDPGSPTKLADSYLGVFAPFHGDYDLSTSGPALAWGLGGDSNVPTSLGGQTPLGMRIDEGPQFAAHLVGLQMWSMRTLGVRQQLTLPGQVRGQLVLRAHQPGDCSDRAAVVFRRRGDERRQPRRHAVRREEARDRVEVFSRRLQSVHADRAVDVHVNEAGVERDARQVERPGRTGPSRLFQDACDAPVFDEQTGTLDHPVGADEARVREQEVLRARSVTHSGD